MSSSTSNSDEQRWKRCFIAFLVTAPCLIAATWLFIVLIDPYDTLHLSPDFPRWPTTRNQRFSLPGLARKPDFDSAVIGNSTVGLLDPRELDREMGGRFVTLINTGGMPAEQRRILEVFARHHPEAQTVVIGVDYFWLLQPSGGLRVSTVLTPHWMYDEDPWNDYAEQFNLYTLRNAGRQAFYLLDLATPRLRADGFHDFTEDASAYDLEKARRKIYGAVGDESIRRQSEFGPSRARFAVDELREMLALLPPPTEKVLLLPPLHAHRQPEMDFAKAKLVERLANVPNLRIVDLMFENEWTRNDVNYWDYRHYRHHIAHEVVRLLARSRDPAFQSDVCRVLLH